MKLTFTALLLLSLNSTAFAQHSPITEPLVTTVLVSHPGAVGGLLTDQLGYVYIADFADTVWRFNPHTKEMKPFATGFYGASGNTLDKNGNIYQASFYGNSISRISRAGEIVTVAADELNGPVGMVFNQANELLVCNCNDQTIKKIDLEGNGTRGQKDGAGLEAEFSNPNGIYADVTGRYLYINDYIGDPNASGADITPFSIRRIELPSLTRILDYKLEHDSIEAMKSAHHAYTTDTANAGENTMAGMNTLGWKYLSLNKPREAVALFELNVAANPDSWRVYSSMGAAYMKVEENEKAIAVLNRSLELNPQNSVARGRLITLGAIEE